MIDYTEYKDGIALEDFFSAYHECRKHKRRTASQLEFELNLEENVMELWRDVNERRYEIGRSICFCITRPKLREVFAASFRDRIIHHVIMQRLEPLFEREFIDDNYNCRKGKGVLYGVERLRSKMDAVGDDAWVAKFDIKGFFMAIDKNRLSVLLDDFIHQHYHGTDIELLLWLCAKVIEHRPQDNCLRKGDVMLWTKLSADKSLFTCMDGCGLPIGNLTSQNFGNFYLHEFDRWMSREFDGMYGRYVDDFYILSRDKERILSYVPRIRDYLLKERGVRLHDDKIYIQPIRHGVRFIGSVLKHGRVYTANRTVATLTEVIAQYNNKVGELYAEEFVQRMNSYLGYLKHSCSYAIVQRLLRKVNVNWWDLVEFTGSHMRIRKSFPVCT